MASRVFMYVMHHNNRRGERRCVTVGTIHAPSEEAAMQLLVQKMGTNTYGMDLLDVTQRNGSASIAIPSGGVISFEHD